MTNWRTVNELKQTPSKARDIATYLLKSELVELSEWERSFVGNATRWAECSSRRAEKLLEIRDNALRMKTVEGFSAAALIRACAIARDDLNNPEDAAFLEGLQAAAHTMLRRQDWRRLLRCARELGEIERYQGHSFG